MINDSYITAFKSIPVFMCVPCLHYKFINNWKLMHHTEIKPLDFNQHLQ